MTDGPLHFARNAGDTFIDASSKRKRKLDMARADLSLGLHDVVLARGEDKTRHASHDTAIAQLAEKFLGAYNSQVYGVEVCRFASPALPASDASSVSCRCARSDCGKASL